MKIKDILKVIAVYQEIKLLDCGKPVLGGYRRDVTNDEWLNREVSNIYSEGEYCIVIDMK